MTAPRLDARKVADSTMADRGAPHTTSYDTFLAKVEALRQSVQQPEDQSQTHNEGVLE